MGDHAAAVPPALWRFTGRRAGQGVVSSARGALHLRNDRGGPCLPRRCCRQAPLDPFAPFDSARAPEAGSSTWSGRPPRNRLSHTPSAVLLAKPLGRLPTTMPAASRAPVSPCPRRRPPPPARCERPSRQAVPRRARDGGSEAGSRWRFRGGLEMAVPRLARDAAKRAASASCASARRTLQFVLRRARWGSRGGSR